MLTLFALFALASAQTYVCNEYVKVPANGLTGEVYPFFYDNTWGNRNWIRIGSLPNVENPAQRASYAVEGNEVRIQVPQMNVDAEKNQYVSPAVPLMLGFKSEGGERGDAFWDEFPATPIQYRCSKADVDKQTMERREHVQRLNSAGCASANAALEEYKNAGGPLSVRAIRYVWTIATNNVDKDACKQENSCRCIFLRIRRTENLVHQQNSCAPFSVDVSRLLADEMQNMYDQRCVAKPCNDGGFCSTRGMCDGESYQFFLAPNECPGSQGGCCRPSCSVSSGSFGAVQWPGLCASSEQKVQMEQDGYVCEPSSKPEVSFGNNKACSFGGDFCCVRPACSADLNQRTRVSGVCTRQEACGSINGESNGRGRCPLGSVCCETGGQTQWPAFSHVTQNNVNQGNRWDEAQFRDKKTTLDNGAAALAAGALAGVAFL